MISQDQHLKEVFEAPPLTAFKRQRNIKDSLIRAKVADPPTRKSERRKIEGMKRCGKMCTICPYIKEGKEVKVNEEKTWTINKSVTCETKNIVYLIECLKCKQRYIGESKRSLKSRLADHRGYINKEKIETATGAHYNQPRHQLSDMSVTILEKSRKEEDLYRKQREKYFINFFDTNYRGLNKQR